MARTSIHRFAAPKWEALVGGASQELQAEADLFQSSRVADKNTENSTFAFYEKVLSFQSYFN